MRKFEFTFQIVLSEKELELLLKNKGDEFDNMTIEEFIHYSLITSLKK